MKEITRRDFIKITSAGLVGAAISKPVFDFIPPFLQKDHTPPLESELTKSPTVCDICFWKCAGWVWKDKKGNIVKITGNDLDPHSNGRLCPRGTGGLGAYYDPDRLKRPLIRVGKPGSQKFKEATWDEAFDYIVDKMKQIEAKYGREAMALFMHGTTAPHFEYLWEAYGSQTYAEPAIAQCLVTREVGFIATYGQGLGSPEPTDTRNTKCLVLIGNHIGENMHNGHVQEMSAAIDHGATIITVDPRFSTAAAHSKYWLPIKPSTDIALLLAWMHVLIYEDLYDKDFVEKNTYGFDYLKNHVKNFTPEWAATITTLDPNLIRQTAYEMAKAAPSVIIHPGRHTAWYGDDTQRERAIAILNALLGSWGRRGGFYFGEKVDLPKYPHPPFPEPRWSWRTITTDKFKYAISGVTNVLIDHSLPEYDGPYKIKGWFVVATNLIQSIPNQEKTIRALQNQDLVVVVDILPTEITGYADVILPEATYLERYDLIRNSRHRVPNLALRAPAVEPKYETKPGWWIARELGIRLGLEKYYPWKTIEELLDWQLRQVGTSLEEMLKVGVKHFERKTPLYIPEGINWPFPTNTGKIELYSTDLSAMGYDPMPVYKKHKEPPSGYLRLIYGRVPMHSFGRTINNPYLNELRSENHLWVHPKVAKLLGLENGQEVWLENQDGKVSSFPVKVRITERIRPDSVYLPHGFGQKSKLLHRAYGRGALDNELITNVNLDPITGSTGMRSNFVKILTQKPQKANS